MASPPSESTTAVPATAPAPAPVSPATSAQQAEVPEETIEVDITDDADSAISGSVTGSTASLASSIVDYPFEYGRRYHKLRDGSYIMPNDEPEIERLNMMHECLITAVGGKLYLAPIDEDKTQRILDIGTGTGVWAIEMGDLLPQAEILGTDLSAIQPTWVPPNVKFEVDDVESEWTYTKKFDLIFARYMTGCILDWPKLVRNMFANTTPGGWTEMHDFDFAYYSDDNSLPDDSNIHRWANSLFEASHKIGRDPKPALSIARWMEDAGYVNITRRRFKLPMGPWPKDPHYKEVGMWNLAQAMGGLEGISLRLFCSVLGWSQEECNVLCAGVRREMKDPKIHSQFDYWVCYGQRPEESTED